MAERDQRRRVLRALRSLHAVPVENPAQPGTPDVNFCEGWIELKWLRRWPTGEETIVRLPHFTIAQRRWLRSRWRVGESAWLLLQVGREWLLFDGQTAHDHVGECHRGALHEHAHKVWTDGLKDTEFRECLVGWASSRS